MTELQRENLTKLCEALESGQYKQGRYFLRDKNDKFCCLGIALDIVQKDGWLLKNDECYDHSLGVGSLSCESNQKSYYMSREAMEFFGFTIEDQGYLGFMNDTKVNFVEISKYIRKKILNRE